MFEFIAIALIIFLFLNRKKRKKKPRGLDAELKDLVENSTDPTGIGLDIKRFLLSVIDDDKVIAENSQYGEIICHCERATRGEVMDALDSAIPPTNLGGLGRRTRAGLGRCQGFYCHSELRKLLEKK